MKYKFTREVDDDGRYHDKYELFIAYSEVPDEFFDKVCQGCVDVPDITLTDDGMLIEEESIHG